MAVPTQKTLDTINGKYFYYAFLAGAQQVFAHQKQLNKINVFPVPDGDTGTNMASTFQYILHRVSPEKSLNHMVQSIAAAALEGSRGNSGIITAQFLHGLSQKLAKMVAVDAKDLISSLRGAMDFMYHSLHKPVEGTIITVIREWVETLERIRGQVKDIRSLLERSLESARVSLQQTMEKLEVLKKNKVVDAGAQGFIHFLEGLNQIFRRGRLKQLKALKTQKIEEVTEIIAPQHIRYRYCTETILCGEDLDKNKIMDHVSSFGDSLVVAGSGNKLRIHIHTSRPADFFYSLRTRGDPTNQKVDDMERQYQVAHNRKWDIALVTDSVCDLPQEILSEYQIHMIPLSLFFGRNHYLDKITITPRQFYEMLAKEKEFPTTSQPNLADFKALYSFLCNHYQSVIAVHISKEFSGTWENSMAAAREVEEATGRKISVINSRHVSGSQGLIVYRIARAIKAGMSQKEILNAVDGWIEKTNIFVSVKNFETMVRGGRVSPMKGWIAKMLNLKPVISVNQEGRSILLEKAFSQKGNLKKILNLVQDTIRKGKIDSYTILHAHDPKAGKTFAQEMEQLIGAPPSFMVDISPAVGISAGRGALAVSLTRE